jgi:hypothetical protein
MLNVLGDSVVIDYVPVDKELCSNGYTYNYQEFIIEDSLYNGKTRIEGESLLKQTGLNRYSWHDFVSVETSIPVSPTKEKAAKASNDTIFTVYFDDPNQTFNLEFNGPRLFPRKYRMIVRTKMYVGGIYDIYVNDELVRTFNYYDYLRRRGVIYSVTGALFKPDKSTASNSFDMWVNNVSEYGRPKIRFEYVGTGHVRTNGLVIDYIDFVPVDD